MQLARVIGTLVATQKARGLEGVKFLVVQPLDKHQQPAGEPVIATDGTAQAGPTCGSADVLYEKTPYLLPVSLQIIVQLPAIATQGVKGLVGRIPTLG